MSSFDGIDDGPHTRGDATGVVRRAVQETTGDPSPDPARRMTDGLALTAPGKRRRAGHRAALCVSIDVDGPYGELSNRPPSNRYDISQTDDDPAGVDRLAHLLAAVDVRGTFCWVGRAAEDQPGPGRRTVAGGHEIALHGWDHRGYRSMSPAEQRDDLLQSAATLLDVSGTIPVGHKTASWSFDETTHALPPVVNLPPAMTYDDDTLFEDKMVTPQATYEFWREDVDVPRADGGLMCLTLHPFVTGRLVAGAGPPARLCRPPGRRLDRPRRRDRALVADPVRRRRARRSPLVHPGALMSRRGNDLVLFNGHVMTMDPATPIASAVAIRAGNVVAVGDDDAIRAAAGPGVEAIDLKGRTATPGLNDAHAHPMSVGLAMSDLDISPGAAGSIADIVAVVRAQAERVPAGTWIVGRGYDQARLTDQRHPTRADLDDISPNHPVALVRACHHIAVANTVALAAAGIDDATRDPEGGTIDRDDRGRATGMVRETAMSLVRDRIPRPTEQQLADALELAGRAFLAAGVTSTVEAGIREPIEMHAYQSLWGRGRLPVRTYLMMMIDETLDALAALGIRTGYGDPWLRIGPAKLFSDGSIGGRTARMRRPFEGEAENVGLWMEPPDAMRSKIVRAHGLGFQVGVHAIGDAAIDLILDAYEEAQRLHPRPDARHRMEHCSIVDLETIRRIKRLGVIPIPGTSFLYHFRPAYEQNLGLDRIRYAYGMRTFADEGVVAAASTDAPVVPVSAAVGIGMMMDRVDVTGSPVWPEERVGLEEAIRAYTWNGAFASFEEDIKGSLEHGKVGDVTVFDCDLRGVAPSDMKDVQIDVTVADGRVAHSRGGAWS